MSYSNAVCRSRIANPDYHQTNEGEIVMKNPARFILTLMVLISLLGSMPPAPVRAATTWVVTILDDDGSPGTLRHAVENAANGDTITFAPSLAGQTVYLQSTIMIDDKNLTIDGSGLTSNIKVSGDNTDDGVGDVRAFYTYSSDLYTKYTVTLDHIDIIDSNINGIYNENGNLIVSNCTISNTVDGLYGAIRSDGNLTVSNCTFSNNQSMDDENIHGGAIYVYPSASITNSTFINNTTSGRGGAIFGAGNIEVINSTFEGNTAGISGGAVNAYAGSISNSTFIGNTAEQTGSGVNVWLAVDLINNTFYNNSTPENNGGTITVESETGFISSIINNTLDSNTGGGIRILDNVSVVLSNNILANSINGADCFSAEDAQITGSNNLIVNNAASPNSCGIPLLTSSPNLSHPADNGGPTQTMALLPGSPAIDAGDNTYCPAEDQRGFARPMDGNNDSFAICDLGAFEYSEFPVVFSTKPLIPSASSGEVAFIVKFSEPVNNVDVSDFLLAATGTLASAAITNVTGEKSTYNVMVNIGNGTGTIRLDVVDDDSIENETGTKLGGDGDGGFASGSALLIAHSNRTQDGWILESTETSGVGGKLNKGATTLRLGDDAANRQYRAILSFDTSSLPEGADITSVTLTFKYAGKSGTLPFNTHGKLLADISMGGFKNNPALQLGDFKAGASRKNVLAFTKNKVNNWYSQSLDPLDFQFINTAGVTQFRLRFKKDDNNDFGADFLKIYSGDANEANRPQLIVEYELP
jgi:predicted outer membrane repeat protein